MQHVRISAGLGILVAGCVLGACATTPAKPDNLEAKGGATTTSTTTSTTLPEITVPTTASTHPTTPASVVVPNVIGLTPNETRLVLRSLGFAVVPLNTPCHRGTTASQSVVTSLSVPGPGRDPRVGATPLAPGTARPPRSPIGVTWSGCYPHGTIVPEVTGLTFDKAVHRLHLAGLAWACFSVSPERSPHSTTASSTTGAPASKSSTVNNGAANSNAKSATPHRTTSSTSTSTTVAGQAPHVPTVLSQSMKPGTMLKAHTAVDFTMHHCPQ
jgi:hypothetical protein